MRILVTAPTQFEIAPFIERFPEAECLISGVGAAISIYHLAKKLHNNHFDMIIQAGVAGSFSKEIQLAEVVKVNDDVFADLGAFEKNNFSSLFELGLAEMNQFPFQSGKLINPAVDDVAKNIKSVSAITVNTLTDDINRINHFSDKYKASIETMEGAVLHYVCLQEKIPFIQLRAISNYVGERDKAKWKLKEAIEQLNAELIYMYSSFSLNKI